MPWPTVLHKLVSHELDDVWSEVIARAKSHPEEVGVQGAGYGQTALHVACYRYPPENAIRVLIDCCPQAVELQNSDGETALHLASDGASEDVQHMLIEAGPGAVTKVDKYGDSPMHLAAASNGSYNLLRRMVEIDPAGVNRPNHKGKTPFFLLSREYEGARSLEDIKPDGEYGEDWQKSILFLRAAHFGTVDAVKSQKVKVLHAAAGQKCPRVLLKVAARLFADQLIDRDENGKTPLAIAASAAIFEEPQLDDTDMFEMDEMDQCPNDSHVPLHHVQAAQELVGGLPTAYSQLGMDGCNLPAMNVPSTKESFAITAKSNEVTQFGTLANVLVNVLKHPGNVEEEQASQSETNQWNTIVDLLVKLNPLAASVPDNEGRLPLSHAIEAGKEWGEGLQSLVWAAPQALETRDTHTMMYPFMIAAVKDNCSTSTVYDLIRTMPQLVSTGIPSIGLSASSDLSDNTVTPVVNSSYLKNEDLNENIEAKALRANTSLNEEPKISSFECNYQRRGLEGNNEDIINVKRQKTN